MSEPTRRTHEEFESLIGNHSNHSNGRRHDGSLLSSKTRRILSAATNSRRRRVCWCLVLLLLILVVCFGIRSRLTKSDDLSRHYDKKETGSSHDDDDGNARADTRQNDSDIVVVPPTRDQNDFVAKSNDLPVDSKKNETSHESSSSSNVSMQNQSGASPMENDSVTKHEKESAHPDQNETSPANSSASNTLQNQSDVPLSNNNSVVHTKDVSDQNETSPESVPITVNNNQSKVLPTNETTSAPNTMIQLETVVSTGAPSRGTQGAPPKETLVPTTGAPSLGAPPPKETLVPTTGDPATSVDWYEIHQQSGKDALKRIKEIQDSLGDSFVASDGDKPLPSMDKLEQRLVKLLRQSGNDGLIMVGDSTTRLLYGSMWCLLEGLWRNSTDNDDGPPSAPQPCQQLQGRLKRNCNGDGKSPTRCDRKATLTNPDYADLNLQFLPNYHLGAMNEKENFPDKDNSNNSNHTVFAGLPCLHSLWSPGSREHFVRSLYKDWPALFEQFYNDLLELPTKTTLLLGTTVTLCDKRLGTEKMLIDRYLRNETVTSGTPQQTAELISFYNAGVHDETCLLPSNYTGTLPVWKKEERGHHQADQALFDEAGGRECNRLGLEALLTKLKQEKEEKGAAAGAPPRIKLVDMHGATSVNGCKDTMDGRHYGMGASLVRQLVVLFDAMEGVQTR